MHILFIVWIALNMPHRKRYNLGYLLGFLFGLLALLFFISPSSEKHLASGPMLPGHEKLKCLSCHKDQLGSLRQQLQANVQYLLNNRKSFVSVGLRSVENRECIKCHDRPNDRHPVYRFREPKYRKVRERIQANSCIACHVEHKSKRVSVKKTFCVNCHDELKLKNDPLDVSHQVLVQQKKWITCLRCHDFHGNHDMKTVTKIEHSVLPTDLDEYFNRGKNPYSGKIINKAKNYDKK